MKRVMTLFCAVALISVWTNAERIQVKPDKIPHLAQNQLKAYFPDATVVEATKDESKIKNNYEVVLSDGTKLEFDKDGNWLFVDRGGEPIPTRMIPGQVHMVLNKNFGEYKVIKMEKDEKRNSEITLSDGTKVFFDTFLKYVKTEPAQ